MNIEKIIKEALEDCGGTLNESQIQCVASWVEGCYENRELMDGPRENPANNEIAELKRKHQEEIKALNERDYAFRKSVANRRGVSPEDVYIENGSVKYVPNY